MIDAEIDKLNQDAWEQRLLDIQSSYKNSLKILSLAESRNYEIGVADSCKALGYCFWRFSDYTLSLSHSLQALKIYQKIGDLKNEADTLNNIGAVYMYQNDNEKRLEVNLKCKDIRQQVGDLEGVSSSEGNIGETYLEMGDYESALLRFHAVLNDQNSSPQGLSWAYHNIGRVKRIQKKWNTALEFLQQGLEICEKVNYNVLIVDSYLEITELFIEQGKNKEAEFYANKALEVSSRIGAKDGEKKSHQLLSKIYEDLECFKESLKHHKVYHDLDLVIRRDSDIERLKTTQLKVAFDKIEEQKNELVDSIKYAEQIQTAVLTSDQNQKLLKDFTVFYQPKDIVSGDFYWYHEQDDYYYLCVADCTGHGVPGAFLTMLGTTLLNVIVASNKGVSPGEMLDQLRGRIISALSQKVGQSNKDGMDISMIKVNTKTNHAEWAGAHNPLVVLRSANESQLVTATKVKTMKSEDVSLYEFVADKQPISIGEKMGKYSNHSFQLNDGDVVYMYSDGFADQFGGKLGKKFMTKNFKKLLLKIYNNEMAKQGEFLKSSFKKWKGQIEQIDDVCVLGFKI